MPAISRAVWGVALAKLALHLAFSARGYGFFGDELYYMACADHLDLGYVDHPPFSIGLLALWLGLFGDSLASLRLLPALLGAVAVVLAAVLTLELGGRARAQLLAAVVVALAPVNLVIHGYTSMNAIDIVVWELAFVVVARLLRAPSQRGWVALGVVLGIGLLNKLSVLWFGAGLLAGLLATPHRRLLLNRGPWLAGGIAVLLFLPHVLWQVAHGWPSAEFMQVATTRKMIPVSPAELFAQQALVWNPVVLPLWLAGFVALIARPRTDVGRVFAWVFVVTAAILIANGTSRPNYLALATPPLVAAGAIALERVCRRPRWGWAMPTALGLVAWTGLAGSPLTLPILPPEDLVRFQAAVGLGAPDMEGSESGRLDQHFADMIGWDAIVGSVADVYQTLPADERGRVAILAPDYATAAAIDRLGPARGLPPAISGHNSYWLWGPGKADGSVVLLVGGSRETWARHWGSLEEAATWDCGDCMAARNRQSVFVARQPRAPLAEMWPDLRHYD